MGAAATGIVAAARLFPEAPSHLSSQLTTASPWLHRFAVFTAAATLLLLGAGGLVTSHGVGMAVPDWPNTYGYNMFLFPVSQWVGGIFYEHSHRLIGAFVGLLTAILAGWIWLRETRGKVRWLGLFTILIVLVLLGVRRMPVYVILAGAAVAVIAFGLNRLRRDVRQLRWLGVVALAAVILQGVLGGLRVVWFQDEIGIFHATLAQAFFVLICALALFTSRWWQALPQGPSSLPSVAMASAPSKSLRQTAMAATGLILLQLVLGATMRHQHAGLAIPDFPLAYGTLWPAMDADSVAQYNQQRLEVTVANPITSFQIALQMAHRLLAIAILVCVGAVAWQARRRKAEGGQHGAGDLCRFAYFWLALILFQAALGAWTIWSNKAADVATAHVLLGALSLVTGALWCIIGFRRLPGITQATLVSRDKAVGESGLAKPQSAVSFHRDTATAMNQ